MDFVFPRAGKPSPFALDVWAVGVFRIPLAVTILPDQAVRLADWYARYAEARILSLADSRDWLGPWYWSLYWFLGGFAGILQVDAYAGYHRLTTRTNEPLTPGARQAPAPRSFRQ